VATARKNLLDMRGYMECVLEVGVEGRRLGPSSAHVRERPDHGDHGVSDVRRRASNRFESWV
jgi:hypothetical protein